MGTPGVGELLGPHGIAGDEHRNGVDERHLGIEAGLRIVLLRLLRTDRKVGDQDVSAGPAQHRSHVDRLERGLLDGLAVVLAQSVERRAPQHRDAELADRGEADGVVLTGEDGLTEVQSHLGRVDVEGGHELDIADVVAAEADMHQTRHALGRVGVPVVLDALHQRAGAVAHSSDGDPDLRAHEILSS